MLTPQQIAQYHEEGYTIRHDFLSRAAVDAILADIDALTSAATVAHHDSSRPEMEPNQGPEGKKVRRIYEPCTYYPLTNTDSVTVLFYLDAADAANGCLQVIPRAQRRVLDHTLKRIFQGCVTETVDTSKAVFLEAKAGSAILMHCLALHSSAPPCVRPRICRDISHGA